MNLTNLVARKTYLYLFQILDFIWVQFLKIDGFQSCKQKKDTYYVK